MFFLVEIKMDTRNTKLLHEDFFVGKGVEKGADDFG
jgi:hypothetical protein